jgi:hypothetical protein
MQRQRQKQKQMRGFFASLRMTGWDCRVISLFELSLAAVEEAGGEEDDGDHEGEAGVEQVAHA